MSTPDTDIFGLVAHHPMSRFAENSEHSEQTSPPIHCGVHVPAATIRKHIERGLKSRDLQAGVFGQGGAFTGVNVADQWANPMLALTVCKQLGATVFEKQPSSVAFPVISSTATAQSTSETGAVTESDLTAAQALTTPHALRATVQYSQILGAQSKAEFESALFFQLMLLFATLMDQKILIGAGGADPVSILTTQNVQTITYDGQITWANANAHRKLVANANGISATSRLGYAISPNTEARWATIQRASGTSTFVLDDFNRVRQDRAVATTSLNSANANDRVIYGDWSRLYIVTFFDGLFLQKNPYTNAKTGETSVTATLFYDAGIVQPQAFVVSTDSGAQ